MTRSTGSGGRPQTPTGLPLAGGCAAVVTTTVVAGALFPDGETAARAAVMAVTIGVYASKVADLRAVLGVTGVAALLFVGFLVNDLGELALRDGTWPYLVPLGLAAVLGCGRRRLRR
ncbi:hypothetical protein AB0H83_50950 [Dactylosporangium sp. NPDC050688]|uniref:hypothetical protein n=1 Tax=Dactylosporangium sp. NPDC050688 TaxID=3157217 RepID=UPI0033E77ACA